MKDTSTPPGVVCSEPDPSADHDLVPRARLRAAGTAASILMWPREDRDEIAAVRDDDADTGWLPVTEGNASVELDLGPAGGPFAMRALSLVWDREPPPVEVEVLDACGGTVMERATWTGGLLPLGDVCGACVMLRVRDAGGARLVAMTLKSGALDVPPLMSLPLPEAIVSDEPFPHVGVVEGFYGRPWTWNERARLIHTLARAGLGLYVYAPKDDEKHRADWRTPYDATFIERFTQLVAEGDARGVRVAMALSPFIDFDEQSNDLDVLLLKLRPFVEVGVRAIALFADDIEFEADRPVDEALGVLHAETINAVVRALRLIQPELDVYVVGTVYSDARLAQWPEAPAYIAALGTLDPSVKVFWTGSDTFSPTIDGPSLEMASALLGRPIGIWDNHWANDAGNELFGRILLAPLAGRTAEVPGAVSALVQNPSVQGAVARLQVGMLGAWWAAPEASASQQRSGAAQHESAHTAFPATAAHGTEQMRILERIMELFDASGVKDAAGDVALEAALDELAPKFLDGALIAPQHLDNALRRAAFAFTTRLELSRSHAAIDVVDELDIPLAKVEAAGALILDALERAAMARAGEDTSAFDYILADGPASLETVSRFRFLDSAVARIVDASRGTPRGNFGARPAHAEEPPPCVVGEAWTWRPFTQAPRLEVVGMEDSNVADGVVSFTPRVVGRHAVVALALPETGTSGFSSRRVTLVCRTAASPSR